MKAKETGIIQENYNYSDEHLNYLKKLERNKKTILFAQIAILVAFFVLWEILSRFKVIDPFIFSSPMRIAKAAFLMSLDGTLFKHIGITLGETIVGFLLGSGIGIGISILLWWNSFAQKIINPYLIVLNALPKTALAPILIVIIGNNVKSVVFTSVMISIVVMILSVLTGFMEVDKEKIKLIKTLGGTKSQVLTKVLLPASMPTIMNALKINIGLTLVGVIVGEFLVAQAGLGYLIIYGSQVFKMDWVMMSVIILCIMASVLYKAISILEKKFVYWNK